MATLPPLFALYVAVGWLPSSNEGVDFRQFYLAARRLLHGGNPYGAPLGQLGQHHTFIYPPLSALLFTPFTALSPHSASVIFGLICLLLAPAVLWVLGCRDWRVYSVTLAWAPAVVAWQTGNETAVLLLLLALLWRHRDRPFVAGVLVAVALSMKVMMWPLALWLLATRRWRAAGWSLLAGVLVNATCWALVGSGNIEPFLRASGLQVKGYWSAGYSITAALAPFGVAHSTGSVLTALISIVLGLAVIYAGYVRRDDFSAVTLTVVLVLVASPIVWNHYLLLLLVPLAIARPRFTWLWSLPILLWLCPYEPGTNAWERPFAWALTAIIAVALLRRPSPAGALAPRAIQRTIRLPTAGVLSRR